MYETDYSPLVPMESVSLHLYSDAYTCHRVPTHEMTDTRPCVGTLWHG